MDLNAIAEGNWKRPIDPRLPCNKTGELYVPFSRHVYRLHSTPSSDVSFPRYAELPAELQMLVIHFCDEPTLFQLMHTSRSTRAEANKLFFSSSSTWYYIGADWIGDGCQIGQTIHDVGFMANIERLHIDFSSFTLMTLPLGGSVLKDDILEDDRRPLITVPGSASGRNRDFWGTVRRRFPRVKHVILSHVANRKPGPLPPTILQELGQMVPSNISVYVYLLELDVVNETRSRRVLWQLVGARKNNCTNETHADESRRWEKCSDQLEPCVIPPYKNFRGPMGRYLDSCLRYFEHENESRADRVHQLAAVEKYHFDGRHEPFGCSFVNPSTGNRCNAWFERPEEYTQHACEEDPNYIAPTRGYHHCTLDDLPKFGHSLFVENGKRLRLMGRLSEEAEQSFIAYCGNSGTKKRKKAVRAFLRQLKEDPLYGHDKPADENTFFKEIHMEYLDSEELD